MKFIREIPARLFSLWALFSFLLTFFIIFIPSMLTWLIPDPKGQDWFIKIARGWMRAWLFIVGCPIRITGKEHFKKGQSYIVTCNHNSLMDVPLSCPFIPGPNKTIAKTSFAKIPFFGFFYMKGSVLVDRSSEESRRRSFEKMVTVLKKGMHMSVYPEGTRNRTSEPLKKFHDGAFRLSVKTGTPVIPAVLFNTKKVLPAGKGFYFSPARLEMHFLPPVFPGDSIPELKDTVFEVMKDHYTRYSGSEI